ncbi:hypothetical protein AHAS_Ahas06G0081700 [Arachis hypogaea]
MAEAMMVENGNGNGNGKEDYGECLIGYFEEGSHESHRYYLSRRTTLEMLKDRGYSIPASEIDLSLSQFRAIHGIRICKSLHATIILVLISAYQS